MEMDKAIPMLSSLAQEARLEVFRLLVSLEPEGLAAGEIAKRLGIAPPTLSHHLKELKTAGLVSSHRDSRHLIYRAEIAAMNDLLNFLTDDCCGGHPELCLRPSPSADTDACADPTECITRPGKDTDHGT